MQLIHGRGFRRRLVVILAIIIGFYLRNSLLSLVRVAFEPDSWNSSSTCPSCQHSEYPSEPPPPVEPAPTSGHRYSHDGLLYVDPDMPHPIYELIRSAEVEWETKLKKASKTLEEAVEEYKRRYKRNPPQGFDDWWDYVEEIELRETGLRDLHLYEENNVQLPDEYDTIWRELEPFWGIDPEKLSEIQAQQEKRTDTFTIAKTEELDSSLVATSFSNPETWEQRALLRGLDEIIDLLAPVEDALPPYRAIFSPHDNPNLLSDYHIKKAALDAASAGEYVDLSKLPPKHIGFASACAPGSPGRLDESPIDQTTRPPLRTNKTFIHNHRLSMDPCLHPYIFYHHSQYVAHDLGPAPEPTIAAQFSYCTTPLFHDIQPPTFISWVGDISPRANDPEWHNKTDERLLWRGSNTGMNSNEKTRWRHSQRFHLVSWANDVNGTLDVLMPSDNPEHKVGNGTQVRKALVNPAVMDIAFTGKPIGCDPYYCDYMESLFEWRKVQSANGKEAGNHKYVVDVDGNGWSSRFKRLITSNSLVFKATAYPEWWLDRSQAWVHYVPVQVDYSDLLDAYVFFRGGLYGEGNHDDLAHKIASAGRQWSLSFWRQEDMTAYFFRLLLEYARIMSPDREAMSYIG